MRNLLAPLPPNSASLTALAAALIFASPAAAQEFEGNIATSEITQFERSPPRGEPSGGPARYELPRAETPRQAPRTERPAPRFERPAPPPSQAEQARPASRGFGGEMAERVRAAQQQQQQQAGREQRADRIDWRSEQRAERAEQRAGRVEQRADAEARRLELRGRDRAAERVDRRTDIRADRIEDRGDARADRVDGRGGGWQGGPRDARQAGGRVGDIRARSGSGWGDGLRDAVRRDREQRGEWRGDDDRRWDQRDGWRGDRDRRDGWRGDRRDGWRGDRRDGWGGDHRGWRRDDWRWGWNGRPGWDRRDFRRWDHRWRGDRRYDWFDFRRGNRFTFSPGPYFAPFRSHRYSRLQTGFFLDSLFFQPRFFINDPWAYHLPPVYGPYQWVRYYDDVVLVDIYTGEVVDVIHDFFW